MWNRASVSLLALATLGAACGGSPGPGAGLTCQAPGGSGIDFLGWVGGYCDHVCHEMENLCATDAYQLATRGPFVLDQCHRQCHDVIVADRRMISNYHCHAPTCEQNWDCMEAPPFDVPTECAAFCAAGERCGVLDLLELRGGAELCSYLCTGSAVSGGFVTQASCMARRLDAGCDVLGALECIPFVQWQCEHVCGRLNGHTGAPCPAGTFYGDLFPDEPTCAAACAPLDVPSVVGVAACMERADCDSAAACWPAAAPLGACADFCAALLARCPTFPYPEPSLCTAWCSQMAALVPGFPECRAADAECPADAHLIDHCPTGPPPPACVDLCDVIGCCGGSTASCLDGCAAIDPGTRAGLQSCLEAASDCGQVGVCLGESP